MALVFPNARDREDPTFIIVAPAVAPANNKSMVSVFNTDTALLLRVHAIWLVNIQQTVVTGVTITFGLRRLTGTAPSAGTDLTTTGVEQTDTANTKNSNWTVRTGATVGTESTKQLWKSTWSADEWNPGGSDVESFDHTVQSFLPMWGKFNPSTKPIILRTNEGITVKCETNTTVGTFDVMAIVSEDS